LVTRLPDNAASHDVLASVITTIEKAVADKHCQGVIAAPAAHSVRVVTFRRCERIEGFAPASGARPAAPTLKEALRYEVGHGPATCLSADHIDAGCRLL